LDLEDISLKASDFIKEFEEECFPSEKGIWISFEDHDPPFLMRELNAMEKQGIIEIEKAQRRYRFTLKATKLKIEISWGE